MVIPPMQFLSVIASTIQGKTVWDSQYLYKTKDFYNPGAEPGELHLL